MTWKEQIKNLIFFLKCVLLPEFMFVCKMGQKWSSSSPDNQLGCWRVSPILENKAIVHLNRDFKKHSKQIIWKDRQKKNPCLGFYI